MQDNDIYKAKEELAELYFYLKSYNSEEVTIKIEKMRIYLKSKYFFLNSA